MKLKIFVLFFLLIGILIISPVKAQLTTCDFFPCEEAAGDNPADQDNVNSQIEQVVQFGAGLIFTIFIGFGVLKIIQASIKIIRSESNADQYQAGQQTIKGVFIGLGMLFIGIIGLVFLSLIFNASGIFNTKVEEPEEVDIPLLD